MQFPKCAVTRSTNLWNSPASNRRSAMRSMAAVAAGRTTDRPLVLFARVDVRECPVVVNGDVSRFGCVSAHDRLGARRRIAGPQFAEQPSIDQQRVAMPQAARR